MIEFVFRFGMNEDSIERTNYSDPMPVEHSESNARRDLLECIQNLETGPWSFIQLRGKPIDDSYFDGDDIDLLGSRESVDALSRAAFDWVRDGKCHLRLSSQRREKTELTLYSIDGRHRIRFDLWIELWQIDRKRQQLQYADCQSKLKDAKTPIRRLPVEIESSVYLHHLVCKRKDISSDSVQNRLQNYKRACQDAGHHELANRLNHIATARHIRAEDERHTLSILNAIIGPQRTRRSRIRRVISKLKSAWLGAPRRTSMVVLMGCDGSGKTTLGQQLVSNLPQVSKVLTGKHFYRKSLVYKLAVIFVRPLLRSCRERFDEILAPLVYLRACLSLRLRLLFPSRGLTLVDRSIVDFLYVDRKTDHPSFCRTHWLSRFFGRRVPTIHFVARFENVHKRKQEMTESGHRQYDHDMFQEFSQRSPTDYIAFNNDASVNASAQALSRIVLSIRRSDESEWPVESGLESLPESTPARKAA